MTEGDKMKTIEYRLDKIDSQLENLKTLMVDSKLQEKDIKTIYERIDKLEQAQAELREQLEQEQIERRKQIAVQQERIEEIKNEPIKKSAAKWEYILDYAFKGLVAAAVLFIFVRLGIQ